MVFRDFNHRMKPVVMCCLTLNNIIGITKIIERSHMIDFETIGTILVFYILLLAIKDLFALIDKGYMITYGFSQIPFGGWKILSLPLVPLN